MSLTGEELAEIESEWRHGEAGAVVRRLIAALREERSHSEYHFRHWSDAQAERITAIRRADELQAEICKAQIAMDNGSDDARWVPGTTAVGSLIRERDELRQLLQDELEKTRVVHEENGRLRAACQAAVDEDSGMYCTDQLRLALSPQPKDSTPPRSSTRGEQKDSSIAGAGTAPPGMADGRGGKGMRPNSAGGVVCETCSGVGWVRREGTRISYERDYTGAAVPLEPIRCPDCAGEKGGG